MLFDSFLSLVWDGSILCRFVEAYSVTQQLWLTMLNSLAWGGARNPDLVTRERRL